MDMHKITTLVVAIALFAVGFVLGIFLGESGQAGDGTGRTANTVFDEPYSVEIDPSDFTSEIDNPYFPLIPGRTLIYRAEAEDGTERIEFRVTNETRVVMGVECVVVWDRVYLEGELIEDTYDWYAQDLDGNVWYFGEDSKEYENGEFVGSGGSWEAGVDGAHPGIIMFSRPYVGVTYRQEFYEDEAEDMGTVLSLDGNTQVQAGNYDNLLVIKDFNPLDLEVIEHKYYAPGIGVVLEQQVKGGTERIELAKIITE